jgi:hypothetical protein
VRRAPGSGDSPWDREDGGGAVVADLHLGGHRLLARRAHLDGGRAWIDDHAERPQGLALLFARHLDDETRRARVVRHADAQAREHRLELVGVLLGEVRAVRSRRHSPARLLLDRSELPPRGPHLADPLVAEREVEERPLRGVEAVALLEERARGRGLALRHERLGAAEQLLGVGDVVGPRRHARQRRPEEDDPRCQGASSRRHRSFTLPDVREGGRQYRSSAGPDLCPAGAV